MNVLFLTMSSGLKNIETSGIYTDLIRKFRDEGHEVYVVYPRERRLRLPTEVKHEGRVHLLGVKTLNVTKTNLIEKGLGQVTLERQFKLGLEKYFGKVKFDIILYSTPPITFTKVIWYAKKRNPKAVSYLLLKDIFPQNAVDLGILTKDGLKGVLYRLFRKKEKDLYRISDYIGCMSPANVKYVIEHNPEIDPAVVEIAPNSYDIPSEISVEYGVTDHIRQKYGLPINKPIFIYGGNMGKPQGIPFLIKCLEAVKDRIDSYFVIVGDGTEYSKLEAFMRERKPKAVSLFRRLPKDDYDQLVKVCDVGLIFLDYRFTIPNYPNRLLPYLMERKPIIAATDPNCDIGVLAEENGYGVYCPSDSVETFVKAIDKMLVSDMRQMGENGYRFFLNNYTTEHTYKAIMKHIVK
ncbi:glycosyltransferase family 4 protein [Parabacteroides goldsteinii]|uniref:glycosyltransferase family 4 protein n=1 Tax=Parabacteroides goldsteinii TaxID=328812 RepID=UPI001CCB72FE|nr:glycosyltransferase family 4 protein [Parabacteroides goldsteinii]UBD76984.1 glycosyltransferase family 4 protein [Parabacteroides goldsteinii]